MKDAEVDKMQEVPLKNIRLSGIFRRESLGDLNALAESIAEIGLLHLPILRKVNDTEYEVIVGERRVRAVQLLGWRTIPAVIVDVDDRKALKMCLAENLARKDLTVLEEARGFLLCLETLKMTMREMSRFLGRSKDYVRQTLLVFKLPAEYQPLVIRDRAFKALKKGLTVTKVRTIAPLKDPSEKKYLCDFILKHGLSRRELLRKAKEVRQMKNLLTALKGTDLGEILSEKYKDKIWQTSLLQFHQDISKLTMPGTKFVEHLHPYERFSSFREASEYAASKNGFCTGLVIKKYWRIFLPRKSENED